MRVYPRPMSTGYRIAEVARRSGFTPATLRYYEEIGLLPLPERTAAGYRTYDDRTLERLAFISRAKELGCTLDEIGDLSTAWDGGQCGPVQDRLRTVVQAKLGAARGRITELITLTAELEVATSALERHRPDGPCDERCGCAAVPGPDVVPVELIGMLHGAVAEPAIACTLNAEALQARLDDWRRVLAFVTARTPVPGGVRLDLGAQTSLPDVARLAAAEQACCAFFSFALTIDGRCAGLEVRSCAEGLPFVHALFGAPGEGQRRTGPSSAPPSPRAIC